MATIDNTWLNDALRKLKGDGTIKSNADVAKALGVSRSMLSNFTNNRQAVSKNFQEAFIRYYLTPKNIVYKKENLVEEGVPIYDIKATGSQLENVGQVPEVPSFKAVIPGYEDCNFGMYVYGHSMYPTVENGSLVLCRKVNDKGLIMYGEVYLIRTADYLMVKRLQKAAEKENVLCTSDNYEKRAADFKRFEPFDLPKDSILDLYIVKGILKKTQT